MCSGALDGISQCGDVYAPGMDCCVCMMPQQWYDSRIRKKKKLRKVFIPSAGGVDLRRDSVGLCVVPSLGTYLVPLVRCSF